MTGQLSASLATAGVAASDAPYLQHSSRAQEKSNDPAEQCCKQEVESKGDRPLESEEAGCCIGEVLQDEDQHHHEQHETESQRPPGDPGSRHRKENRLRRIGGLLALLLRRRRLLGRLRL